MKYLLLISLYLSFLVLPVFAQEFDFNRAYQDYLYNYNQYREVHNQYITAKNQYLTYKTLTAKNKALIATREMLRARSEVLRTYLTALKLNLKETTELIGYQANTLYLKLDSEAGWLSDHHDTLSSPATIEDLLKVSEAFEKRYPQTEIIIYQTIGEIIKDKETDLYERTHQSISETEEKILEIKRKESEKALVWERWLLEAKNKTIRSLEKSDYAGKTLSALKPGEKISQNFHQAQFALKESNQYLKEAVFYLLEIIQKIKYD